MALPDPIPDNPLRWEGWRTYNSDNFYDRLCLSVESNPGPEEIEDHCRRLLVWWQKKLPLKNQPSNPMAQLLRAGLDEAPGFLAAARTELLNPESRARIDAQLLERTVKAAGEELKKFVAFVLNKNQLNEDGEARLLEAGAERGLSREVTLELIESELTRLGAVRVKSQPAPPPPPPVVAAPVVAPVSASVPAGAHDPVFEFRRVLRLSKLALDGDEMTDDQRDAMCNMGESLGLTGGQAEDLIDEYLEQAAIGAIVPAGPEIPKAAAAGPVIHKPAPVVAVAKPAVVVPKAAPVAAAPVVPVGKVVDTSPVARALERQNFPNFSNSIGQEMFLINSGVFNIGSDAFGSSALEQPVSQVTLSRFFLARFPVTNAQYEAFDASHRAMRAPWANDNHPVVYVNSLDAEKFCQWLSSREGRKYRLPTEAEWEYAACGVDNRVFPWGPRLDAGHYANFADRRTSFGWKDQVIDDGFAESAPVGSYPQGKSPFGIEDLSGNVFEWCLDFLEPYKGRPEVNRRGPAQGTKRVCRGGSWKSRSNALRAAARHFNLPDYSANDVGFRVLCECD